MGRARDEAGNIWETDAQGNPVRLVQQAAPQMPADPTFPYQGAQAQAQAANTGAEAQVNQATIPAQITSAQADATAKTRTAQTAGLPEGFMWGADGQTAVPIPGYTRQGLSPEVRQQAIQAYTDADALDRAADEIQRLYDAGPGTTSGLRGIQDYFPTDANKVFNDAGQQARGYVKRALGFTGGEGNTVAESSALYDPYLPTAGDRDAQIEAKIRKLRELANDSRTKAVTTLGGRPDGAGNIIPIDDRPNALTQLRIGDGEGPTAAPFGSTTGGGAPPPELVAEQTALVARLMQQNNGRIDPEAYAREFDKIAAKYPGFAADPAASAAWASEINTYLDQGGRTVPGGVDVQERELSATDQFRNNLVSNPVGAAAAGFADMGGFGGVSLLAPDAMAALGEAQPVATTLGQIGGSIGGTSMLGRGVKFLAERTGAGVAPRLLGGGTAGQVARNIGTDAAYSGIYGANTGQDPLESAAWGAGGSAFGQGVGSAAGRAIGGVDLAPAVQFLRERGVPMTVPQQLGGFIKGIEDKAISMPLVGDMIRARRMEGIGAFNREAFNEAGSPINAAVNEIGQEGIEQLGDQVSDAYGSATQFAQVNFDPQFLADMQAVEGLGQQLPDDYRALLAKVLQNRVQPITDAGVMTGTDFQQALRGLKGKRATAGQATPGFEDEYRDALTAAMDALEGQMMRGGASSTVEGLTAANAANRNLRTIEDAANRAAGGSESGTPFVFTPSQLQRAGMKTQGRFPGARPFAELSDAGQAVLPSRIPNSGTADRAAQMLLPGAILGGGGIGALAGGDAQGAGTGAGLSTAAMLALLAGGTKGGQKVIQRAVIDRPASAKMLGRAIRDKRGLFGSASLPLLIADY